MHTHDTTQRARGQLACLAGPDGTTTFRFAARHRPTTNAVALSSLRGTDIRVFARKCFEQLATVLVEIQNAHISAVIARSEVAALRIDVDLVNLVVVLPLGLTGSDHDLIAVGAQVKSVQRVLCAHEHAVRRSRVERHGSDSRTGLVWRGERLEAANGLARAKVPHAARRVLSSHQIRMTVAGRRAEGDTTGNSQHVVHRSAPSRRRNGRQQFSARASA